MVTLFGIFETGSRALFAQQAGLAVTGNNIANVNTEGYSRQRVNLTTTPDLQIEPVPVGTGVQISSIERIRSAFLDGQIRQESSNLGYYNRQADILSQLEVIFNDPISLPASSLEDSAEAGLNASLTRFFDAIQEVTLEPESTSVRTALQQQAEVLVSTFNLIDGQMEDLQSEINSQIQSTVSEINGLLDSIAEVNMQVARLEVGEGDQANNLRDQRDLLISQLSSLIPVEVNEMESGAVNVSVYGVNAVQPSSVTHLQAISDSEDPTSLYNVVFEDTGGQKLDDIIVSGELGGLLQARDTMIPFYQEQLDTLAQALIREVNKIHTTGSGLVGYEQITGDVAVTNPALALNSAGLDFTVQSGTFNIVVEDSDGNTVDQYAITVDPSVDSLNDLAAAIDAADGTVGGGNLTASVTGDNHLVISAGAGLSFKFQGDSSEVLSALGINTFFSGYSAGQIRLSPAVRGDGNYFAASSDGTLGDNSNALAMAQLQNAQVLSNGRADFNSFYQGLVTTLGTEGRAILQLESNTELLVDNLEVRQEELAGVSLDEETVNLLKYQRAYTAASRFITSVDELLQLVVERLGLVGR